jgi:hypothetical protein
MSNPTTNSSTIGIKQLKMMIKTGIPGQEEYIEFNSSLLPVKSKGKPFAKYPFFSDTHAYPKIKLQDFTYDRIVEFFFNKDIFTKIIRNKTQKNLPKKSQQKIKIDNFELTLRLLFPTTYPLVNNIDNSVEYIIPSKKIFTFKGSNTFSILPRRFDRKYSYLNIGSETYTITKTVWNNDVMNHPVYSQFIQTYKEFDIWKSDPTLNIFQNQEQNVDNIDIILKYVFDAVQKSDEDPLFKKMYDDPDKAPYSGNKRLDENTLAIQDFDNTIDELMRKDEGSLREEIKKYEDTYETEYGKLITDLSNNLPDILEKKKQKHDSVSKQDYTKFNMELTTKIDTSTIDNKTNIIDNVNEIVSILEKIQKKKQAISKLKLNKKTNTSAGYYKYLTKINNTDEIKEKTKENFLKQEYKYKSNLINLLGKLTNVKTENYHNLSPDFLNLIDYLKTNISDFNNKRRIFTFIKDLNIKFLSDPNYKKELDKIKSMYVEFYNLALVIDGFKGRKIDNLIWRDAVLKMMNGTLGENYFNDKIWEPLQDCYHLDEAEDDSNKKKSGKKCDPDVISVGLDVIPSSKEKQQEKPEASVNTRKSPIQSIEIFLQMDVIEGKIDDTNVNKIKCAYDDEFLGSMFRDLINTGNQINTFPEQVFFSAKKLLADIDTDKKTKVGGNKKSNHRTRKCKKK